METVLAELTAPQTENRLIKHPRRDNDQRGGSGKLCVLTLSDRSSLCANRMLTRVNFYHSSLTYFFTPKHSRRRQSANYQGTFTPAAHSHSNHYTTADRLSANNGIKQTQERTTTVSRSSRLQQPIASPKASRSIQYQPQQPFTALYCALPFAFHAASVLGTRNIRLVDETLACFVPLV